MYVIVIGPVSYETFEDTKGVIEFYKSKADRENNNQIREKNNKTSNAPTKHDTENLKMVQHKP